MLFRVATSRNQAGSLAACSSRATGHSFCQRTSGQFFAADVADPAFGDVDVGVATASWTALPLCNASGGLSITRSCGDRPAVTSTLSPKSRPSWTDLNLTVLP